MTTDNVPVKKNHMRVHSGEYVDLDMFTPEDVDIMDISTALNEIRRFTGHHRDRRPLTVAQHTLMALNIARDLFPTEPEVHFDVLLHDMPEAFTGDIATPLKRKFGDAFRAYENEIEKVVYRKLWVISIPFSEEIYHKRKICDLMSLDIERRSMWRSQKGTALWPDTPVKGYMSLKEKQDFFDKIQQGGDVDLVGIYNELVVSIDGEAK